MGEINGRVIYSPKGKAGNTPRMPLTFTLVAQMVARTVI